jgi:hypothetical protein
VLLAQSDITRAKHGSITLFFDSAFSGLIAPSFMFRLRRFLIHKLIFVVSSGQVIDTALPS